MQVVLQQLLPICGELLWIDLFMFCNTGFCMLSLLQVCGGGAGKGQGKGSLHLRATDTGEGVAMLSLLQSSVTILIEQNQSEYLLPTWLVMPLMLLCRKMPFSITTRRRNRVAISDDGDSFTAGMDAAAGDAAIQLSKTLDVNESIAGVMYRQYGPPTRRKAVVAPRTTPMGPEDMERLCYFEKLFFRMDEDQSGQISQDEAALFLSFVALDMEARACARIVACGVPRVLCRVRRGVPRVVCRV